MYIWHILPKKTLKAKEKEKNIITRDLKTMSIEERKVENIMKNHANRSKFMQIH